MSPPSLREPPTADAPLPSKLIVFVVAPVAVTGILIAMYFSGVPWLQSIVAPHHNRELGLLENLQNAVLLGLAGILLLGAKRRPAGLERRVFGVLFACTLFVFLEEIDYGTHVVRQLAGKPDPSPFSLHNIGSTGPLKQAGDVVLVLCFVIAPLCVGRSARPLMRYVTPDRSSILTVAAMLALSRVAHLLQDTTGQAGSLSNNIAEFRELNIYYLVAVHAYVVVFRRRRPELRSSLRDG